MQEIYLENVKDQGDGTRSGQEEPSDLDAGLTHAGRVGRKSFRLCTIVVRKSWPGREGVLKLRTLILSPKPGRKGQSSDLHCVHHWQWPLHEQDSGAIGAGCQSSTPPQQFLLGK